MKKIILITLSSLLFASNAIADADSISDKSQITAQKVTSMCSKMKPTTYSENEVGKVVRKGCSFSKGVYTINYEVSGKAEYLRSMENSGIKNQNAKLGDKEEFKKYCTSYAWLVKTPNLANRISVEYRDTAGKLLASKYIDTKDCK